MGASADFPDWLIGIVDRQKLTRDRTLQHIKDSLTTNIAEAPTFLTGIEALVASHTYWEAQFGCLEACAIILPILAAEGGLDSDRSELWKDVIVKNLDSDESRVRRASAQCAGALVKLCGLDCYSFFRDLAVAKLKVFMVREEQPCEDGSDMMNGVEGEGAESPSSGGGTGISTSEMVLHDTAGWRALESYMACLQEIMKTAASSFEVGSEEGRGEDEELLQLVSEATEHKNRFVREMSHHVLTSTLSIYKGDLLASLAHRLATMAARGLSDNWSQVRMSASVLVRCLCQALSEANLKSLLPVLLPPMCLNRYYIAEGVRLYSQETWKLVFGDRGRHFVSEHLDDVISFYMQQAEAENHAVREATCACVTELVTKIDKAVLNQHVPTLLELLLTCFDDDSWPVRDSACVAIGFFVEAFPEQCAGSVDEILDNLYHNLTDNIPSVREGAAVSLKKFAAAYPDRVDDIFVELSSGLASVSQQPDNSTENDSMEKGPATYSVVKQRHDNDISAHENQTMYSCGSLAPKMKRGTPRREKNKHPDTGGCSGHSFKRPGQPWEMTDGFVLLLAEMSSLDSIRPRIDQSIVLLFSKVFQYRNFTHHPKLFTTCYKSLANLFTNMGKMFTKRCLEMFLDGLFYGLNLDNKLAQCAAEDCFVVIAKIIGPNILKGRVENFDSRYLDKLRFIH